MDAAGGPADRPGTSYAAMASPSGLTMIAGYADGIGPNKVMVIPRATLCRLGKPTALVRDAHAAGLTVHPWAFRRENHFLPLGDKAIVTAHVLPPVTNANIVYASLLEKKNK